MTESTAPSTEDRFKRLIAFLIALVTVFIAVISYLQSDAGARDDAANRDTKRYALEAFGKQVSGDARVNFDYNSAYQSYYELDLLAQAAQVVGDDASANRYLALRDRMTSLSPMLEPPYFDSASGVPNVEAYETDTYIVEITALKERFAAASIVKDAWDTKANTYIVHLTLLAVSLFLFGLSTTISGKTTRWIFAGVGSVVAVVATAWAVMVFFQPVEDLRQCQTNGVAAIDAYAKGVGLAYQSQFDQAIASYDQAIACKPDYLNAWVARGDADMALGNYESAATDYEKARAAGSTSASVAGDLAWAYYLLGRYDDAITMNRTALQADPSELWIQYDLGLALLAKGELESAKAEYQTGMDLAAKQVAEAKAAGAEPPSFLWWGIEDAAVSLDDLITTIDSGQGDPPSGTITNADSVANTAAELSTNLKGFSVALEYTGQPPAGSLTASVSPFTFAQTVFDEAGNFVDYAVADTFEYGIDEVAVLFDYDRMNDGQDVLFKVYVDGEEDPSWRVIEPWSLGASGSAEKLISFAYSNTQVLRPGVYTVEMYVDSHLAQSGNFEVAEP
jgi:tetratricopeptide (TPR) repeat protein